MLHEARNNLLDCNLDSDIYADPEFSFDFILYNGISLGESFLFSSANSSYKMSNKLEKKQ